MLGNVRAGVAETEALQARYTDITTRLADNYSDALMAEIGRCRSNWTTATPGISTPVSSRTWTRCAARRPTPTLKVSGGERRRVALCRLLLQRPDLLLLDEPTNHLDAESVQWLEAHLAAYPGTVVAVTHDRYFLDNVAQRILELDRGHAYPYQGNYTTYLEPRPPGYRCRAEGCQTATPCSANWTGCVLRRWPDRPKAARGCAVTKSWRLPRPRPAVDFEARSTFHRVRGWAIWSSRLNTWARRSVTRTVRRLVLVAAQRNRRRHRSQRSR